MLHIVVVEALQAYLSALLHINSAAKSSKELYVACTKEYLLARFAVN